MDHEVIARGLVRLTGWFSNTGLWDCGMAFLMGPVFEEAYAIRASLLAGSVLEVGRVREVAHAFCDRAVATQGVVEQRMYCMGYGGERDSNGTPNCSCVADAASSAAAIVETIRAFPDSPRNQRYLDSLTAFAAYVSERYTTGDGVIGVGILGHKVNSIPEYWCANALMVPALIGLGELTGRSAYLDAAVSPLEFLASFDYRNTSDAQWTRSATEMVFYASEGILAGLGASSMRGRLSRPPGPVARRAPAAPAAAGTSLTEGTAGQAPNRRRSRSDEGASAGSARTLRSLLGSRWEELAEWLSRAQDFDGSWPDAKEYRCYQAGLTATMLEASRVAPEGPPLGACVERQLHFMASSRGRAYLRLFAEPFGSALAHLSFARAATVCREAEPERFARAVAAARSELDGESP